MKYNRNYSLASIPTIHKSGKILNSISAPRPRCFLDQLQSEPVLKPNTQKIEHAMRKNNKNSKSIKILNDCTNQLLRQHTSLGPYISFTSKSSINKISHHKILGIGGITALQAIKKRQLLKYQIILKRNSVAEQSANENLFKRRIISEKN